MEQTSSLSFFPIRALLDQLNNYYYPFVCSSFVMTLFLRRQISIAKILIEEGTKAWNMISQNNHQIRWENVVFEIEEYFMKIACCSSRSLTQQVSSSLHSSQPLPFSRTRYRPEI